MPISRLRAADSPRLNGLDLEHARALAESNADLPPIVVSRSTMRVIDGMHRVSAAEINQRETIRARFFDGKEDEEFLLAVEANIAHGLPLTLADRRAAAERIVLSHPELSDRAIATIAGIAAKTVRAIRVSATGEHSQTNARRIGRDGRTRPLSSADGRRAASQVLSVTPDASLREIARAAGISVGTARDVRERMRAGRDPVPPGQRRRGNGTHNGSSRRAAGAAARLSPPEPVDPQPILEGLRRDPSLRYTESGRALLRWLGPRIVVPTQWHEVIDGAPPHVGVLVGRIARACAAAWTELAEELERRNQSFV